MLGNSTQISVKKYGDEYRLTVYPGHQRRVIPSEWEEEKPWPEKEKELELKEKGSEKFLNNIARAKAKVFEYATCNEWQWFVTFTLDKTKYDRFNLKLFYKDFAKFLNNYQVRYGLVFTYILVPEMHIDGAWHMHGLLSGLPKNHLCNFTPGVHPQNLIDNGYKYWPLYEKRFGFCSFGAIRDSKAAGAYIVKYIGKGFADRKNDVGDHLYYCSRGLQKSEVIAKGAISPIYLRDFQYCFENDFVKVVWLSDIQDETIAGIIDNIR